MWNTPVLPGDGTGTMNRPAIFPSLERDKNRAVGGCCGCFLVIMLINLTIGAVAFDYCLYSLWGKDIPWYGDVVCGAVLGEFAIPVAIACLVMRLCGIPAPFFP